MTQHGKEWMIHIEKRNVRDRQMGQHQQEIDELGEGKMEIMGQSSQLEHVKKVANFRMVPIDELCQWRSGLENVT